MKFEVLNGPEDGKKFDSHEKETVTFGRGADLDLPFPYAAMISRVHGEFVAREGRFFVKDSGSDGRGSKNGIIVKHEETRLEFKGKVAEIYPGDIIIIGKNILIKFLG